MVRLRYLTLTFAVILTAILLNAQTPCGSNNPQCENNVTPYAGHGPASSLNSQLCSNCSSDSRRVVVVRINSSWDSSPSHTNSNIWDAVNCAINNWNSATDGASPPNRTGYYFVLDQQNLTGVSQADITITNEDLPGNGKAANDINLTSPSDPNRKNTISLDPVNGNLGGGSFGISDLCGRIGHELGHLIGLNETTGECNSVMSRTNADGTRAVDSVQPVDVAQVNKNFNNATRLSCTSNSLQEVGETEVATPTPTPTPFPFPTPSGCRDIRAKCTSEQLFGGYCNGPVDYCENPGTGCPIGFQDSGNGCCCTYTTPIVIDTLGNGFRLTRASDGVLFDMNSDGQNEQIAWTSADGDDAWLVLDRNGNSIVDNGAELFGNFTPQPRAPIRNGFLALAEYDKAANGGNDDGIIDARDSVYSSLRLWYDVNHNGQSEFEEIQSLPSQDIYSISLEYKESRRKDEYGNEFRYRSKVGGGKQSALNRWAYDVFLRVRD